MNDMKDIEIRPGDKVMNVYTKIWATVLQVDAHESGTEYYVQPERGLKASHATSWPATVIGGWRPKA